MTYPNKPGPWFAKGAGPNRDLRWQLFLVDEDVSTGKLVVRLAEPLHTEGSPWFTPSPKRWTEWVYIPNPGQVQWEGVERAWRVQPCVRERPNVSRSALASRKHPLKKDSPSRKRHRKKENVYGNRPAR